METPPSLVKTPQPSAPVSSEHNHPTSHSVEENVTRDIIPLATVAINTPENGEDHTPENGEDHDTERMVLSTAITRRLYISHFLSTWNSRSFEFGAVLFLAAIFPLTLLPLSIYALVRSASTILFGPVIGRTIDRRSRLPVVRFSIGKSHSSQIFATKIENKDANFSTHADEQLRGELE